MSSRYIVPGGRHGVTPRATQERQVKLATEIPPRLSAVRDHPDYDPVWSPKIRGVELNGQPVADCVRVDVKECWVEVVERDERGERIRYGDWWATRIVYGDVSVHFAL